MRIVRYSVDDVTFLTDVEFESVAKSFMDNTPAFVRRLDRYLPVPRNYSAGPPQGWEDKQTFYNQQLDKVVAVDKQGVIYELEHYIPFDGEGRDKERMRWRRTTGQVEIEPGKEIKLVCEDTPVMALDEAIEKGLVNTKSLLFTST